LLVSDDNKTFETVVELSESPESIFEQGTQIKDLDFGVLNATGRYLKIEAQNPEPCPKGHIREGQGVKMCSDELIVK